MFGFFSAAAEKERARMVTQWIRMVFIDE
jgi:hypothetical protein